MLDFDPAVFLVSLIISSIGFVSFVYGKKQSRIPHMAGGLVLMIYPYFVSQLWIMILVAVMILVLQYVVVRMGY